jgi:predicted ribosome quality control (RQC) complex YloA/Tae2 family protein
MSLAISLHPEHNTLRAEPDAVPDTAYETPLTRAVDTALKGARLVAAAQAGLDRVAGFSFEGRDRLGDPVARQLVLELTDKGANLVLLEGETPLAGRVLTRIRDDKSRLHPRHLVGGSAYTLPRSGKIDASSASPETLAAALEATRGGEDFRALAETWEGVSPVTAAWIWASGEDRSPPALANRWAELEGRLRSGVLREPAVVEGGLGYAEALPYTPSPEALRLVGEQLAARPAADLDEALLLAHRFFRTHHRAGGNTALVHAVRRLHRKTEKALEALGREHGDATDAAELRRLGEAVLASAHRIPPGAKDAVLPDPAGGGDIAVRLNPAKSASENAELYFKKARKTSRSGGKIGARRDELAALKAELDALAARLDAFAGASPDAEWLREARRLGVPLPREQAEAMGGPGDDGLSSKLRPRRYDLGGGWEVLVGKTDEGNHLLTFEISRPQDTWMHAENCPGSHVVLRHDEKGKIPPREVLLTAAGIAAFFSKARNSAKVPVTVTERRHVRRPRKAPAGQALVGEHKTLIVVPTNPEGR